MTLYSGMNNTSGKVITDIDLCASRCGTFC